MDVPYTKSGASSRAHYQIVRNVENAPQQSEKLLVQEVERIRKHFASKMLSTSEIRKDLIILLYCLNTSFGSINRTTLAFALPSAAQLAEAGSRVSEKRIGYMFCWEVMPREHELQLMLVNTIRKDLTSPSVAKINLALESLVNLPSLDVVPAVHTRCIELLSHPSPRIRELTMIALHSLSQYSPELLNDDNMKQLVVKRLSDADESVVRTALRIGLSMVSGGLLESEEILRSSTSLVSRIVDKHTAKNYSSAFTMSVLNTISRLLERDDLKSKVDYVNELLPSLLSILRRAVKHGQGSLILECFRLMGRFPTNPVAQYILKTSPQPTEPDQQSEGSDRQRQHFVHPVARIRHFLSSRTVNDHYLFLSCLVCLEPSLWAGTTQPSENLLGTDGQQTVAEMKEPVISQPVLDQLEVERVLSFLDSEDDQIRALTLRLLITLDPSLVENCYQRVLDTLRAASPNATNDQVRNVVTQRLVEFAFTTSLGNEKLGVDERGRILVGKLKEVINATGAQDTVNKMVVESVLSRVRRERPSNQRICILNLLMILQAEDTPEQADRQPLDKTLFLILVALTCELALIFAESLPEVVSMVCLFAATLHTVSEQMQEPILLCMTRLAVLLSTSEVPSQETEDVRRVVHELGETSLEDQKRAMILKRSRQFEKILSDPSRIRERLGNGRSVSLPEFALMLDGADSRRTPPRGDASTEPSSPPSKVSSPTMSQSELVRLSQSKLRYDAYAAPTSPNRIARVRSHSSSASGRSSNRASSRASSTRTTEYEDEPDLSRTVTVGELTLAAGSRNEFAGMYRDNLKKGKTRESESVSGDAISPDTLAKKIPDLLTIDSPFLAEPLVDVDAHPTPPSPYVSANTSLRTSPEPGQNFEQIWSELTATPEAFNARGWCEDATEVVVRRLQSMELRMDVLSADDTPFLGDLKIMLHSSSLGPLDLVSRTLLRLHEEDDGSCRWQVRCTDKKLGLKVKELLG